MNNARRLPLCALLAAMASAQPPADAEVERAKAAAACAKWVASADGDRALLQAAVDAVLRAGPPAIADLGERVAKAAAADPPDKQQSRALDALITHVALGFLERESRSDMVYEGQYAPLLPLQPYVGRLFLDLLIRTPDWYDGGNRHALVAPLRDLFPTSPGKEALVELRAIATDEDLEPEPLRTNLAFALAQWGDRELIDARIARIEAELAGEGVDAERRGALRYELADIHYTLRDYERAARIHVELLRQAETAELPLSPNHYYNAACALARAGQKAAALDELERAVELQVKGAVDPSQKLQRKLFERDRDLDGVRGDPRFAALFRRAFPDAPGSGGRDGEGRRKDG